MGTIMIRCPNTGRAISTGREVASAAIFRSVAVFSAEHIVRTVRSPTNGSQKTGGFGTGDSAAAIHRKFPQRRGDEISQVVQVSNDR